MNKLYAVKKLIPKPLLPYARKIWNYLGIKNICKYHENDNVDLELTTLRKIGLRAFPYEWITEHSSKSVNVLWDEKWNLPYVDSSKYRLYYPRMMSKKMIRQLYNDVVNIEQDIRPPIAI